MDRLRANLTVLIGGRSEKSIAEGAGVDQTWLNRVMNPERSDGTKYPKDKNLKLLADYFGISVADLRYRPIDAAPEVETSLPVRLDQAKLTAAISFMRQLEASYQRDFLPDSVSLVLAAAYDYLLITEKPNTVEMSIVFGKMLEAEDERLRKAAGSR